MRLAAFTTSVMVGWAMAGAASASNAILIDPQIFFIVGVATDYRPSVAQAVHYALRKGANKTVMPPRNFSTTYGFGPDEIPAAVVERKALNHLFSVTYEELSRLASTVRRSDPGATASPTTLVNEAWLKLANFPGVASTLAPCVRC
jgi:hypothetical protein